MIESVFIWMASVALVLFVLGIEKESIIYSGTSLLMWIITMAGALYVHVPGDTNYMELGFNATATAFIFINIAWMIMLYMDVQWLKRNQT